jgi:hypothetical protein
MRFRILRVEVWGLAVCRYEGLSCQVYDMRETAAKHCKLKSNTSAPSRDTHLIFRFCQAYFFPVMPLKRTASSCIIVELLDALSHVT